MDLRWASALRLLSLAAAVWFVCSWLAWIHGLLLLVGVLLACGNVAIHWSLRFQPQRVARWCRHTSVRRYCELVSRLASESIPATAISDPRKPSFLLQTPEQYRVASERAKTLVRGHDDVIDGILSRLREGLVLRRRRRDVGPGAIASFLLAGPPGIGKRYLARVLAKLLYTSGEANIFACARLTVAELLGTKEAPGELMELLRKDPHRVLVFECLEDATVELIEFLTRTITTGVIRPAGHAREVSLLGTTVLLLTEAVEALTECDDASDQEQPSRQPALIEALTASGKLDPRLLHCLSELFICRAPDDRVKSEVLALLMARECAAHQTELIFVEPIILASHVVQVDREHGFSLAPQRVSKMLRRPLVAAAAGNHRSLSLRLQET